MLIVTAVADPPPRSGFVERALIAAFVGNVHPGDNENRGFRISGPAVSLVVPVKIFDELAFVLGFESIQLES